VFLSARPYIEMKNRQISDRERAVSAPGGQVYTFYTLLKGECTWGSGHLFSTRTFNCIDTFGYTFYILQKGEGAGGRDFILLSETPPRVSHETRRNTRRETETFGRRHSGRV